MQKSIYPEVKKYAADEAAIAAFCYFNFFFFLYFSYAAQLSSFFMAHSALSGLSRASLFLLDFPQAWRGEYDNASTSNGFNITVLRPRKM